MIMVDRPAARRSMKVGPISLVRLTFTRDLCYFIRKTWNHGDAIIDY